MKRKSILVLAILCVLSISHSVWAGPTITDPYADAVISYTPGPGVGNASQAPPNGNDNPDAALGAPEYNSTSGAGFFVSLGDGGSIVLAFTDNIVVDGPGWDLKVYEVGSPENAEVLVSNDSGATFVSLGTAYATSSFDLLGTGLTWANTVRIVDDGGGPNSLVYMGFDLDAVEALNSAVMPAPGALMLGGIGAVLVSWLRRRRTL